MVEFNIKAPFWTPELVVTDSMTPRLICLSIESVLSAWDGGCLDIEKPELRAVTLVPELISIYSAVLDIPISIRGNRLKSCLDRLEKRFHIIDKSLRDY